MTFTVNVLLTCILNCDAGPGYDKNCLQVQWIDCCHRYHICPRRESYTLVQRNSHLFLTLSDRAYVSGARCIGSFSFDSSSTTGFVFNSIRISLLTVLRVVLFRFRSSI